MFGGSCFGVGDLEKREGLVNYLDFGIEFVMYFLCSMREILAAQVYLGRTSSSLKWMR